MDMEEVMNRVLERIKSMTPDEYRRDILCLNGEMTFGLFNKVMTEVLEKGMIDDETLAYFPERFKITSEEFRDVFHYLEEELKNYIFQPEDSNFPNNLGYFKFWGKFFRWDLLIGQGSACYLVYEKDGIDHEKYDRYKTIREIDKNIRFFKRVD